jgi:hypothetical protein
MGLPATAVMPILRSLEVLGGQVQKLFSKCFTPPVSASPQSADKFCQELLTDPFYPDPAHAFGHRQSCGGKPAWRIASSLRISG